MVKIYFLLFIEFLKIGVFALGGGYATLPFLYYLQSQYNWFSTDELTNMIAVSNITPGPVGINMATYTGYTTAGFWGALIASVAIILIPFFIVITVVKLFNKLSNCNNINYIFTGLRPASCALLTSIGFKLLFQAVVYNKPEWSFPLQIDLKAIILFIILIIPFSFIKKNPILIILAGALGGIFIQNF